MTAILKPSRRLFLAGAAGALAAPALAGCSFFQNMGWRKGDPFSLGVAAGDPSPDGFVIWTRLAPDPLHRDETAPGGMSGPSVPVAYEIAADERFKTIVQQGTGLAEARYAYSVHVEVTGLTPGRPYWYRFHQGDAQSRVGRAMTAPSPGAPLARLNFGFASCSNYEHGYFAAYRHLADEAPDLVLFLGDYIYEYADLRGGTVRRHSDGVEAKTLPLYRNRYAQYRLDPDLQRLHATSPALMTWDDHEVQNDYADQWSQTFDDPSDFLKRRAAAYQAYYEHMPVRPSLSRPDGPTMRIYSSYGFGDLAAISMLDGRQYRSREACYGKPDKGHGHLESNNSCPERLAVERSMIGMAQEKWLFDTLAKSKTQWNIVGQDVLMVQQIQRLPSGEKAFWTDDWNGYPASRARLLQHIHDSKVPNPVVVGGDIHAFFANDLKIDFDKPNAPVVATEFVGTSITAHPAPRDTFAKGLSDNPQIKFFESLKRGYAMVEVTPKAMVTRFEAISDEKDPAASRSTLKTFTVESGKPGPQA
jgi:alkaline phosphatase D